MPSVATTALRDEAGSGERPRRSGQHRCGRLGLVAATALIGAFVAAPASAAPEPASGRAAVAPGRSAPLVRPGINLIRNGGAEVGDASGNGFDAVTIPGWRVVAGLPSVIRYGLARFVAPGTPRPHGSGRQLFVGGAGGPATLTQQVRLRGPGGGGLRRGTTYDLSAALGARRSRPETASVHLEFLDAGHRVISAVTIGPVTARSRHDRTRLLRRWHTGVVPPGTRSAIVEIDLDTTAKDWNGPDGSTVGFDSAYADDVALRLSSQVEASTPLQPPVAHVPRFAHVVVVYLENQDYHDIVGNTRQAPFVNQLIGRGTLLSHAYAEEHPSDANYLALAAGSALDLPLDDPAEENSQYTLDARNIGDLLTANHETWRAYLQSADGSCDDTVHNQYWDDDLPFLYFKDVRERPAYCADHVTPQSRWATDLRHASTTPRFSWLGANDCDDMEGCGIKAGDSWLRSVITPLLHSPAWQKQRTLLVVTWDEDAEDGQHPAQRIPTVVVGSRLVRHGGVSPVRATHYSVLRTIEAALGVGSMTENDRWAQPLNDVFDSAGDRPTLAGEMGKGRPGVLLGPAVTVPSTASAPANHSGHTVRGIPAAWVVDSMTASLTPVDLAAGRSGPRVGVGRDPDAAVTGPGGRIVWVSDAGSGAVTPVDARTRRAARAIAVGRDPSALALTPDGRTLLVADEGSGTVTPITTATRRAGHPIRVGAAPSAITVSARRDIAYVVDHGSGQVTPIDLRTLRALPAIRVGSYPVTATLSPDGRWLYVANFGGNTVTPIDTGRLRAESPVDVGRAPMAVAFVPDGSKAYVVDGDSDAVTPITVATRRAGRPIPVGSSPEAIVALAGGKQLLVVSTVSGTVTPISVATDRPGRPIVVGADDYPTALVVAPGGRTVDVVDTYAGAVTPIDLATDRPGRAVSVGPAAFPVAVVPGGG